MPINHIPEMRAKLTPLLIFMIPIALLATSCITIRGSGSSGKKIARVGLASSRSASRPNGDAEIDKKNRERMKKCYEQEKTNPRPVRFTCDQAVQILNAKDRLNAWPTKCKRKLNFQKRKLDTKWGAKVKKQKERTVACYEKNKIYMRASRKSCKILQAYLIGGTIGVAVGIALGVLGTVVIYQLIPAK